MTFIESETIELKSSVVADLCKEVIAFANTKGGTLYIGVEDNGTVVGVDSADRITLQITQLNTEFVQAYEEKYRALLQLTGSTFETIAIETKRQADSMLSFGKVRNRK